MSTQLHHNHPPSHLLNHLLSTITHSIIPLTTSAVSRGCKVFGASILHKSTLKPIISSTNDEITSPLLHGEMSTLFAFHRYNNTKQPCERIDPKDCIFLTTHEPCSLCLSAITWSGFDNFYYLFTYQDTKKVFSIPHDIRILQEVFQTHKENQEQEVEDAKEQVLYNKKNAYWECFSLAELVEQSPEVERDGLRERMESVKREYNSLSDTYQQSKSSQVAGQIPLA
ncbi:uncharacterized protein UTRI_10363_B [Ustilago trichophora]|uniref:CMP/dCMP-type deaminase domain-containing protein n=1 Tax=Ustilago trichophora TaxID=86804 RepID=A0A5C3E9Q3_9BASI|nr:uncharacterized protein UTRI_10363_B [Ustilago trichophora]